MNIIVHNIRNDIHGYSEIASIAKSAKDLFFDELILDFSPCSFFEANMSAPLYSVIAQVQSRVNVVEPINMKPEVQTILAKNHFLKQWKNGEVFDSNATTLPFKRFKLSVNEQFFDYLDSHMRGHGLPQMSNLLRKRFLESLLEIFQNSSEHSASEEGIFVCGQFFPSKKRLDFSIADAGIGFRDKVRSFFPDKSINSIGALRWALKEGSTTKGIVGGLGLKLLKDFIRLNKGKLQIVSRYAYYEYADKKEDFQKMKHDFPGTCVNLEINTDDASSYRLRSEGN